MTITYNSSRGLRFSSERRTRETLAAGSLVVALHDHWLSICPEGLLPARRHFDPARLSRRILPWVFLLDVLKGADGPDYRFRLVGTANARLVGRDATGRLASEIFGSEDRQVVMDAYDTTVAEAQPTFWLATVPHERLDSVGVERGFFPLADDGRRVDQMIGIAVPTGDGQG